MPKGIKGSKANTNPHREMLERIDQVIYTHIEGIFNKQEEDGTFKDAKLPYILCNYAKYLRGAPKVLESELAPKTSDGRILSDEDLAAEIELEAQKVLSNKKITLEAKAALKKVNSA